MKIYLLLILLAACVGCSRPTFVYRFHNQNQAAYDNHTIATPSKLITMTTQVNTTADVSTAPYTRSADTLLLASTSSLPLIYDAIVTVPKTDRITFSENSTKSKTKSVNVSTHVTADKQEGDPTKNGAATAGLVLSLLGITVVFGFILAPVFAIAGAILSAQGLKSEKKKRAKAGLILSIAAIVIGLIFIIYLATSGGYGA